MSNITYFTLFLFYDMIKGWTSKGKKMLPINFFSPISFVPNLPSLLAELTALPAISPNWLLIAVLGIVAVLVYILNKNQLKTVKDISEQALEAQSKVIDQFQEQATEVTSVAQEKINQILDEFQKFIPVAEELGLKVENFSIEAGVLPKIKTSLRGSIDNIKNEKIEQLKLANSKNKLLIAVFNAILLAKKCNDKLESVYISIFKDIIVDIQLGLPPAISVRFQ